jgi:hypothetical protein
VEDRILGLEDKIDIMEKNRWTHREKKEELWKDYSRTLWCRVKGWKKIFQANGLLKQAGLTIFISDKEDFKHKLVIRDKECYFI